MNPRKIGRCILAVCMALGLVTLNTGCFKMAVPEDRPLPVILWPLPPDIPRISFVNSLSRPEDITNALSALRMLSALPSGTNVVVTWQNAEVSRGRDGVKAYYERMLSGPSRVVESFAVQPTVDELTLLYGGDTGIAFGRSRDHFVLKGGLDFTLDGRWSATLVRHGGRWVVASFYASANLFDNVARRAAPQVVGGRGRAAGGPDPGRAVGAPPEGLTPAASTRPVATSSRWCWLLDGANAKDGKPGNMHKYLGKDDAQRATNLALFKRWVGGWNLKRGNEISEEEKKAVLAPRS